MHWIYLSPHLDDVALSCGGLIWEQTCAGHSVEIWTICAGDPPPGGFSALAQELHTCWQTGPETVAVRRLEDRAACARLNATPRHFPAPDCIYRRAGVDYWNPVHTPGANDDFFLYPDLESVFGALHPLEAGLVFRTSYRIARELPYPVELVVPLAIGGHIDHCLTRAAAEMLQRPLWYYADYPYAAQHPEQVEEMLPPAAQSTTTPISSAGLEAWWSAISAHSSQIKTYWPDLSAMYADVKTYCEKSFGGILWRIASHELAQV